MNNSKSYAWLEDLIKATLKANIIVLTYNPTVSNQLKVDPQLYQNINIDDFIHKIYIECARELWNNPYLFYHNYPPIELKRNQRDSVILIKDCIKEALRKLLPVKHILSIYLGEEMEVGLPDDNFNKSISEIEEKNLNKLIKKDLLDLPQLPLKQSSQEQKPQIFTIHDEKSTVNVKQDDMTNENTVGSKILDIIKQKNIGLTDNNTSEEIPLKLQEPILECDSSETSISVNPNRTFQEVFSNKNQQIEPVRTGQDNKTREQFFSKYLKLES
jgi:hypothetical protein